MIDSKALLDSLVEGIAGARDVAMDALDQAATGVKEVAGKAVDATGADDKLDAVVEKVSGGQSASDLIEKAKDVIAENKLAAGVIAGGLGALLVKSKRGRKVAKGAAALGGAALIGGLAYQAFKNFRDGKPLLGSGEEASALESAPAGSGFEAESLTDDQARLLARTMIAAAAADNQIDETERMRITLGLKEAGLEMETAAFLEQELAEPVQFEELASEVDSPELAAQIYAAARLTIEPDSDAEKNYLEDLASSLSLEDEVVAHLDQSVSRAKEPA